MLAKSDCQIWSDWWTIRFGKRMCRNFMNSIWVAPMPINRRSSCRTLPKIKSKLLLKKPNRGLKMNRDRYDSFGAEWNDVQFIDGKFHSQVKNQKRLVRVQEMMSSEEEKKKQKQHKAVSACICIHPGCPMNSLFEFSTEIGTETDEVATTKFIATEFSALTCSSCYSTFR